MKNYNPPFDKTSDPFSKYYFDYKWGSTALYEELLRMNKPKERSEFDIEFNGYFYEFSDMGELIKCFLIDKMINEHITISDV